MLSGSENTLSAAIKVELDARVLASTGSAPATPNVIIDLTESIAYGLIPHLVSFTQVLPGSFTNSAGPVTGIGALL